MMRDGVYVLAIIMVPLMQYISKAYSFVASSVRLDSQKDQKLENIGRLTRMESFCTPLYPGK